MVEVGQEEASDSGAVAHVLDHSFDWLAAALVHKVAHVLHRPLDLSHVLRQKHSPQFNYVRTIETIRYI